MKRIVTLCLTLTLLCAVPAMAFNQADVDRLNAGDKDLQGADLSDYKVPPPNNPNKRFDALNLQGATLRNSNLDGRVFWNSNLSGVDFAGTYLRNLHVRSSNMSGSSFNAATFPSVIINASDMSGTDLSGIITDNGNYYSQFRTTNLTNANFGGASLTSALFYECDLTGAQWTGVNFGNAKFTNCTIDASAKPLFVSNNVTMQNITWAGQQSAKPVPPSRTKIKTLKPATPKGVPLTAPKTQ